MKTRLNYEGKNILAPMVRIGTLPTRLLALRYGAEIVYSEEIIDWKLLKTKRRVNDVLKTIDYVDPSDGNIIFRTCDLEKGKVVLQLGTSDSQRALAVAKKVQNDVTAIDINMGCPKSFSIKGGMGAALLYNIENATKVLRTLVENLNIQVTCKIRIKPEWEDTLKTVKELEATGISAITVHGRTKDERPGDPCHTDIISKIAQTLKIPVIANGGSKEIEKYSDIDKFRKACGVSSVMIARSAMWNVSIFRKEGMVSMEELIKEYLKLAIQFDNSATNTKYCVQMILRDQQESPMGKLFLETQTLEQICDIWDLGTYCRQKQLEYHNLGIQGRRQAQPGSFDDDDDGESLSKKPKLEIPDDVVHYNVSFIRANYGDNNNLPKTKLYLHGLKTDIKPCYEADQQDKLFRSIVNFDGKKYTSSFWEKNKKYSEQGAALACLLHLGLVDKETLILNGSIIA